MALSEQARSSIYNGLSNVVDQEAVAEMLSYFPIRDTDEPVTKDHLDTQIALIRSELHIELSALRNEIKDEVNEFRTETKDEMAKLRSTFESALREQLYWLVGTMITLFAICTTLILAVS